MEEKKARKIISGNTKGVAVSKELISLFEIDKEGLDKDVSELSGGERAKVLLTKVLLQNPGILILDEPSNNLDYKSRKEKKQKGSRKGT